MLVSRECDDSRDILDWLQYFYSRHCDKDWEHSYGFRIDNVDNPGWLVEFDLNDTKLSGFDFKEYNIQRSEIDWIICKKKENKFVGYGGVFNLKEILKVFREWADNSIAPNESVWL
jgi:hypothetical protein